MGHGWRTGMWLALLATAMARGQVGHELPVCVQRWGQPVSGAVDTNGYGVIRFATGEGAVEIEFVAGTAQRIAYRMAARPTQEQIDRVLAVNGDFAQWETYRTPGRGGGDPGRQVWMRSDDAAMAELVGATLSVMGSRWHQHLAEPVPPAASGAKDVAGNNAKRATNAVSLTVPAVDIVGLWCSRGEAQPMVVLEIRDTGDLSCMTYGETERRSLALRWTREAAGAPALYTLVHAGGGAAANPSPPPFGRLEQISINQLRWQDGGAAAEDRMGGGAWGMKPGMRFTRINEWPRWTPRAPAALPAQGDTRPDAVRLLGRPTATLSSGGREVLDYPWGRVWIVDGVVHGVEQKGVRHEGSRR